MEHQHDVAGCHEGLGTYRFFTNCLPILPPLEFGLEAGDEEPTLCERLLLF